MAPESHFLTQYVVMKGKTLENIGNPVAESGGEASECGLNQLSKEFTLGDIVWIKIHGGSWWPAQVPETFLPG